MINIFKFYYIHILRAPKNQEARRNRLQLEDDSKFGGSDVESIPSAMRGKEAIVIDDIRKTFKGIGKPAVHAVQGISLKVYPGEITAILGEQFDL